MSRRSSTIAAVAIAVVLILSWSMGVRYGVLDAFFLGDPLRVWQVLVQWFYDGTALTNLMATVIVLSLGLMAGIGAGVLVGTLLATSRLARDVLEPYIAFFNGLPRLVFYPIFAVILGYSLAAKILHVAFVIVFLVVANTVAGLQEVDKDVLAHGRIIGGRRRHLIQHIYLPSLALWLISSSRASVGLAFQAVVVAEFIGTAEGLGHLAARGQGNFDINMIWAAVSIMVLVAVLVDGGLGILERRVAVWQTA